MQGGQPISYMAVTKGTPMYTKDDMEFGTVEHVLQIPAEDLFDGIVVQTANGTKFVDRDQIAEITDIYIVCDLDHAGVATLPLPDGPPVFHADAFKDMGNDLHDKIGRMFKRHWTQDN